MEALLGGRRVRLDRPTLSDVSNKAGVSTFTASRALRDGLGVAPETVARVRSAAEEIGYVPNDVARALRGENTRTIGLLTSNVANRFFGTLLQGINASVAKTEYQVLAGDAVDENGVYQVDAEERFVRTLLKSRVSRDPHLPSRRGQRQGPRRLGYTRRLRRLPPTCRAWPPTIGSHRQPSGRPPRRQTPR